MLNYTIRRLMFAVPTLLIISFIIFAILDLAPNDPTGNLPLTIPAEVRAQIRESLGLGQPFHIRYFKWLEQFFINEPLNVFEQWFGTTIGDSGKPPPRNILGIAFTGCRSDRRAHAANTLGRRSFLRGRYHHCFADWRDFRLPAIFVVRPGLAHLFQWLGFRCRHFSLAC